MFSPKLKHLFVANITKFFLDALLMIYAHWVVLFALYLLIYHLDPVL